MEGSRHLDALARDLARGQITRRTALRRFLGGATGLALPSFITSSALARCPPSRQCGDKCCPHGAHCKRGKCKCKAGLKKCGKKCVDLSSSETDCGSCGHACAAGQTCVNGQCTGGVTTQPVCGDGKAEGSEICDGTDLKGATCQSLGFIGGTLGCSANCTYDTSGCTSPSCTSDADCPPGPPGDCQRAVCTSGTCGFVADNADVSAGSNPCTNATCADGVPSQTNVAAGTACPAGVCNGQGACVGCNTAADCPQGSSSDCQKAVCVSGTCGFTADDTETPASDGNPCTIETCVNGAPSQTNAAINTPCGFGNAMFCDGQGACVGCNNANQCPPTGDPCRVATCNSNVCGSTFAPASTVCQAATCSNGTQTNARTCDGGGICQNNGTQSCAPYACGTTTCRTFCTIDDHCATGFACANGQCLRDRGQSCTAPNQCASGFCVDGVCCESSCAGVCEKCNQTGRLGFCDAVPAGTDPDNECSGGTGFCNGARACG